MNMSMGMEAKRICEWAHKGREYLLHCMIEWDGGLRSTMYFIDSRKAGAKKVRREILTYNRKHATSKAREFGCRARIPGKP